MFDTKLICFNCVSIEKHNAGTEHKFALKFPSGAIILADLGRFPDNKIKVLSLDQCGELLQET